MYTIASCSEASYRLYLYEIPEKTLQGFFCFFREINSLQNTCESGGEFVSYTALGVLTISLCAAASDLREGKIPNDLLFMGALGGLYLRGFDVYTELSRIEGSVSDICPGLIWKSAGAGAFLWAAGFFVPFAAGFLLFRFGMMGAGDSKLLAVIGGMIGFRELPGFLLLVFVSGGGLSLLIMAGTCGFRTRFRRLAAYAGRTLQTGEITSYRKGDSEGLIHFSVPVLMAALLYAGGYRLI